jgi:hypothetical protein
MMRLSTDQNADTSRDGEDSQDEAHVHKGYRYEWQDACQDEPNTKQQHPQIIRLNPFHWTFLVWGSASWTRLGAR